MKELAAGGQTSSNLLVFLFLAYQKVEDKDFIDFIKMLKMHHDSGIQQITSQELMDQALTQYNQSIHDGTWKMKMVEQEQLIALTVQLKDVNNKIEALQKTKSDTTTVVSTGNLGSCGYGKKPYMVWHLVHDGNKCTKTVSSHMWYWCEHHQSPMWVWHKPTECRAKNNHTQQAVQPAQGPSPPSMTLQLAQVLTAIADGTKEEALGITFK